MPAPGPGAPRQRERPPYPSPRGAAHAPAPGSRSATPQGLGGALFPLDSAHILKLGPGSARPEPPPRTLSPAQAARQQLLSLEHASLPSTEACGPPGGLGLGCPAVSSEEVAAPRSQWALRRLSARPVGGAANAPQTGGGWSQECVPSGQPGKGQGGLAQWPLPGTQVRVGAGRSPPGSACGGGPSLSDAGPRSREPIQRSGKPSSPHKGPALISHP